MDIKDFNSYLDDLSQRSPDSQVSALTEIYRDEFNRQYDQVKSNGGNLGAMQDLLEMILQQLRMILNADGSQGASDHSQNKKTGGIDGVCGVSDPPALNLGVHKSNKIAEIDPQDTPISFDSTLSNAMPKGRLSDSEGKEVAMQVMDNLIKDFGLTPEQAAGVVGNLYMESDGMNPHINQYSQFSQGASDPRAFGNPTNDRVQDSTGYGWAQWGESRKDGLIAFAENNGMDPGSAAANYGFLKHELSSTSESAVIGKLKQTDSVADAMVVFRQDFERAAVGSSADQERLNKANEIYELYKNRAA
ncbi:conserved hypothetical protein [Hahella chejuensis KCTC 2396]|uniref:Phage tail lysozyme domain-containing protein n=1 Tax=Hahella chejuensis (strain KCTC 2396) TaxID=349521 RepID=Q2SGB2_HAHCH|nr:phage tail tip lysozyme [Hahella chejuensis]ABC30312.1 conserved hypothetical protein [Hahella chejuensis KCTC 2396]